MEQISYFDYIKFMGKRWAWTAFEYFFRGVFWGLGFCLILKILF